MSPNYYTEQMCEAKMDPESPASEDVSKTVDMRTKTGTLANGKLTSARTNVITNEDPPGELTSHHYHHHDHHDTHPMTPQSQLEEEELDEDDEGDEDGDMSTDDMISVGGSPSSPDLSDHPRRTGSGRSRNSLIEENIDEYFRPFKKLRMVKVEPPSSQNAAGLKSFSISDILSHKPLKSQSGTMSNQTHHHRSVEMQQQGLAGSQQRIVRPWDPQQQQHRHHHHHHHSESSKSNGGRRNSDSSPLDALFQMTSKTFEGLNGHHDGQDVGGQGGASHQAFSSRQPPKKKRKSRTAFTNHQIFELEKRFLYQKYLSPADRDDIAQQLGLTNAQVITWFQNRRAKLKRDLEELKKDVESAKLMSAHKSFLESAQELGVLRKRAQSQADMMNPAAAAAAASFHMSSPTSGSSLSSHSPINLTSESPPSTH